MEIQKIESIDFDLLYKVITSNQISEIQKTRFLTVNRLEIDKVVKTDISSLDFKKLMKNRTLKKFRPLKNSYTKLGDKIILAKALGIEATEVPKFIKEVTETMQNLEFLPQNKMDMLKTYVYRHGTKDQLVTFLDWELKKTKDMTKTLYSTLSYYSGGVADYFIRPIHRMDNKTLINIYNVIDKNIQYAQAEGSLSENDSINLAKWALVKIYEIQNNSKLINAVKTYKTIK